MNLIVMLLLLCYPGLPVPPSTLFYTDFRGKILPQTEHKLKHKNTEITMKILKIVAWRPWSTAHITNFVTVSQ